MHYDAIKRPPTNRHVRPLALTPLISEAAGEPDKLVMHWQALATIARRPGEAARDIIILLSQLSASHSASEWKRRNPQENVQQWMFLVEQYRLMNDS